MSNYKIIASETVRGESDSGYQTAISSAIRHGHVQSNASCEVNIILFDMHFENGKFMISIQIIVNQISPDIDKNYLGKESKQLKDETFKPVLKPAKHRKRKKMHTSDLREALERMHHTHDMLMEFNNESIYDHLETSLHNTWEIHPDSLAYHDIHQVLEKDLKLEYKNIRLYTQTVDDIATLIPENTGFTRHFVDFAMQHQRHDWMTEMNNQPHYKPTPRNDNLHLEPKISKQWDDK